MTKKELVKKKIGKAAMQCFEKFGLDKTTLDDIAKTIGLNKATLYYYYRNKEDIFIETAIAEGLEYITILQRETLKKKGTESMIWFYMLSRFNYYAKVLSVNRVSVESLNKILPRFFELYDDMREQEKKFLSQLIKKAIADGLVVKTNADKIASLLINVSDALKHSAEQICILKGENKIDYVQSISDMKFLVSLIFEGLKK
jgi:AcrR family transcriptional regulator